VEHFDAIVVGSGFGGSVVAERLARGGQRVCVLERGRAYPPGSFPRRPRDMRDNLWDPASGLHGLYHVWSFRGLEAVASSGLGGGSLIYANVLIRKDERWFVHDQPLPPGAGDGEVEHWPISRADLDPHYDRVERMLGATPFPHLDAPKTAAMREAAARLDLDWHRPNLAVTFAGADGEPAPGVPIPEPDGPNLHGLPRRTCRLCGECDIGCNDGAKNTLDFTYLSSAQRAGADIRTRAEVRRIRPRAGGGYEVDYVAWGPEHEGRPVRANDVAHHTVGATRLVLAAGALGTPWLLLRNRSNLPALGEALGSRFSGNGDLLSLAMRATDDDGAARVFDAAHGPVITSAIRVPDEVDGGDGRGYYIEDAGFPTFVEWVAEAQATPTSARRAASFARRWLRSRLSRHFDSDLSAELGHLIGDAALSSSSMPLLGMGRDVPDGRLRLRRGMLDVDWTIETSEEFFSAMRSTMRDIAAALGAEHRDNLLWLFKRVITVHPLGGAPMGRHVGEGVVDEHGQAFGHPGLFVVDGAAMPGPVGPNPSLTIAAFADRVAERILATDETVAAGRAADGAANGAVASAAAEAVATAAAPSPGVAPSLPPQEDAVEAAADAAGEAAAEATAMTAAGGRPAPMPDAAVRTLAFTEEMKGHVALGHADFREGARRGRRDDSALMFRLTIEVADVDAFVADADREASASGWVECDPLGGRLPVTQGVFNLFVDGDDPDTRRMLYRLWFHDAVGNPLTLVGFKTVRDNRGLDVWTDTSTLFVRILRGHVDRWPESAHAAPDALEDDEVVAAGIIVIHLLDFAQQLTTFRVTGPDAASRVRALSQFGELFLGELWRAYGRRALANVEDE
jgi:cholesterol oxidase